MAIGPVPRRKRTMTDTAPTPTRTVDGLEAPAPGRWQLDTAHTTLQFVAKHLMVAKVRGGFTSFAGTVDVAERLEDSAVEVTIDADSVSTGDAGRDEHLRTNDFFGVEATPQITFRSTRITRTGQGRWDVTGDLTIRGNTREVVLDAQLEGLLTDPWGTPHAVVSASAEVDREAFGLTWNQTLETGGVLVGKRVKLEIEAQLVPATA
jgi:polyisoprenoid-binding protein YceI